MALETFKVFQHLALHSLTSGSWVTANVSILGREQDVPEQ